MVWTLSFYLAHEINPFEDGDFTDENSRRLIMHI